ncbi:photosystem I reaction center subunit PsaK [Cyanobacterium stanieri LEGE 03274]|uniref:Photosystem I reaction center subunit PsaK n=1 Tax=Cyanobacterium stanieri LEGE 03274 TaxID=1828756 RepID=A0ABR9V1H4_9CHRO|nr:photosystem I reaction center subunit PsaK [Cyanobacterium stanieri]MBE9221733.1 photosystem I reaction center subunit PsaK [Cyanobacterium stanieri LEGE 03274]
MNLIAVSSLIAQVPQTVEWNFQVALVMISANLLAVFIGRFAIQKAGVGPDLPLPKPAIWKKFGLPELLATASLGHILGAGFILGLSNAGLL